MVNLKKKKKISGISLPLSNPKPQTRVNSNSTPISLTWSKEIHSMVHMSAVGYRGSPQRPPNDQSWKFCGSYRWVMPQSVVHRPHYFFEQHVNKRSNNGQHLLSVYCWIRARYSSNYFTLISSFFLKFSFAFLPVDYYLRGWDMEFLLNSYERIVYFLINFLLEYSWFTMLCKFQVYSKVIQLYIYI